MKKFIALIIALIVSSQAFSQTDGYQKTKGAHWSDRPVARMIYGGSYPPGYTVYVLEQDYFVRFIDSEQKSLDQNDIVFPKGEKVYQDNTTGIYFSAIGGSQIADIKPVEVETEQPVDETMSTPVVVNNYIPETQNQEIVVYYDNSYRYYQPYYEGTNMFWSMIGYEIFYNNLWHRVPYAQYYGWNQQHRRTSDLGKYRHSEPPRDTYRESRQRPQQGTRGTGLNHGNNGNRGGAGNGGNKGGPGGAPMTKSATSRNYDNAVYQNGSSNSNNRRPATTRTTSQKSSPVNNGYYNQNSQRKVSTPSVKSSNPSSYRSNNAGFRNPSYTPSVKSSNAVRSSGYSTSSTRSSSSSSGQNRNTSRR